jgi:hypothetical protein
MQATFAIQENVNFKRRSETEIQTFQKLPDTVGQPVWLDKSAASTPLQLLRCGDGVGVAVGTYRWDDPAFHRGLHAAMRPAVNRPL